MLRTLGAEEGRLIEAVKQGHGPDQLVTALRTTRGRRQVLGCWRLRFNEGPTRGYQFFGTGTYGGLLVGDTCPTSNGGPNGIWSSDVFLAVPFEGLAMVP